MKQKKIINAYKTLSNMYQMRLPVREAHAIFLLKRQLEDQYYFQLEQEKTLLEEFNGTITRDGDIRFSKREDAEAFHGKISELNDMEIEIDVAPAHLQIERIDDIRLTPEDMEHLDGFIEFE